MQRRISGVSGGSTSSAVYVDPDRSLRMAAVYACVTLLAEAVAGLPVVQIDTSKGRQERIEDDLWELVALNPNPDIDAGELWRNVMGYKLLRGNSVVFIERNRAARPIGLWPISPQSTTVRRGSNGRLFYTFDLDEDEYAPVEADKKYFADDVMHFRAFGLGTTGLSPIGLARESVGMGYAAQQYMGGFYARDATPGGAVVVEGELSDAAYERMERQWKELHEGWSNSHRLAVMEGGAKWQNTTLNPADALFIDTMKFTRGEIASIYGVPPFMIGDTEKSTSWGSGIAEQGIGFVQYSLMRWVNRIQSVTRRRLLEEQQRTRKFLWQVDGLKKGDTKSRYDAYAVGKQWGWLSTNDVRREEGMDAVDGGDVYLQPLNMVPAGAESASRAKRSAPMQRRAATETAWQERVRVLVQRYFERQREAVLGRLDDVDPFGDLDEATDELRDLLRGPALEVVVENAQEVADSLGAEFDPGRVENFVRELARQKARNLQITTRDAVDAALTDPEVEDREAAVGHVFDVARDSRAEAAATTLVVASRNFGRHEGGEQAGARTKTWRVSSGNPRTSHALVDGETVPIDQPFSNGLMWPGDSRGSVEEVAGCTCELEINK